jgi:phytoene dehydrogenase-like protein
VTLGGHAPGSPDSFDVVIIGAGHNGMTLGAYLARCGLSVGIFERRGEEGGGLCTEEITQPGFLHNVHANYHTFVGLAPAFRHLDLFDQEIEYVHPDVQMASIFDDGTALTIHAEIEQTLASIARFSEKDAETFARLKTEAGQYINLMLETFMYGPPVEMNDLTKALVTFGMEGRSEFLEAKLRGSSITQFLDKHFESDAVKAHLAFHGAVCGYRSNQKGLAVGFPLLVGKIDNWNVCLGGSHRLAHALWRDLALHGGVVHVQSEVSKILTEGGRAVGVELFDGRRIEAKQLVASSIDPEHTFGSMLVDEPAVAELRGRLDEIAHLPWSLFSVHLAMDEAPKYTASGFDGSVDEAWVVNLGMSSLDQINADWERVTAGELPDPRPNAAVNSLFDPYDAPEGKYTGLLRQIVPNRPSPGAAPEAWDDVKKEYAERCIAAWDKRAPNVRDAVIEHAIDTPVDITRKLVNMIDGDWMGGDITLQSMLDRRPLPELSGFRTPVERLYMCGATQHPHGYITFAPGYNALQVIAQDLDLEPWWKWD